MVSASHIAVSSALRGRDMLCFGHDFAGDPLSKTHLMRLLARDNRVLWVNSIGYRAPRASGRDLTRIVRKLRDAARPVVEVEPNLFVLHPIAIPAWGRASVRALNGELLRFQIARAMRRLEFRRPISWVYNPTAAVVAGRLGESLVVYHCVDEFTAFSGVPPALAAVEDALLRRAELTIVSSERLLAAKAPRARRAVLVRHGVAFDHFRAALAESTIVPDEIARLPRPVLGYFGLMGDDWIDVPLLARIADRYTHGSLVLLGEVATDLGALASRPNVHLLGRKPFASLPAYCKGFDVALAPLPLNDVTRASNPLKVREYLAAGLPVVSTRIPEIERVPGVRIADGVNAFLDAIEAALVEPGPRAARSEPMRAERWEARLDEICRAVTALESP